MSDNEDADAPPEFLCPITMSIMRDPVIMPDGQTYERKAITEALNRNPISPLTRQPMSINDAKVNYALKSLIDKYLDKGEKPQVFTVPTATSPLQKIELELFNAKYCPDPDIDGNSLLHVQIKPKTVEGRLPLSLIAMIDVSGSMGSNACQNIAGLEDVNYTRLQLVQHSLNTITECLSENDMLTFIVFSNSADLVLKPTKIDEAGKKVTQEKIKSFTPSGGTNIWDALRLGIQEAQKFDGHGFNTSLLLFTDGEPNQNPPMGIIPCLEETLSDIKVNFTISSFAFGYSIDSDLMEEIAHIGNGVYGYCPDCTMVGTIFINYMANLISTILPVSILRIKNKKYDVKHTIGLYNGIASNLCVSLPDPETAQINLSFPVSDQVFLIDSISQAKDGEESINLRDQRYRRLLIDFISKYKNGIQNDKAIEEAHHLFEKLKNEDDRSKFLNNIMIDLYNDDEKHGQIEKSFMKEYYRKWGNDYLRSILRFHVVEQCGNFKDMSLQLYGSEQFKTVRKAANKIFMNLPPPPEAYKPEIDIRIRGGAASQNNTPRQSNGMVNMSRFMARGGGCFNGDALVNMKNNEKKRVDKLKRGDELENGAKVACVVKIAAKKCSDAVKIGNAYFTPYHPVKIEGKWIFPVDFTEPQIINIDYWYNLVLDGSGTATIGGVEAVTLGHEKKEGVCSHPYFGTKKVIEALMKREGYEDGEVTYYEPPVEKRDPVNDLVIEYY